MIALVLAEADALISRRLLSGEYQVFVRLPGSDAVPQCVDVQSDFVLNDLILAISPRLIGIVCVSFQDQIVSNEADQSLASLGIGSDSVVEIIMRRDLNFERVAEFKALCQANDINLARREWTIKQYNDPDAFDQSRDGGDGWEIKVFDDEEETWTSSFEWTTRKLVVDLDADFRASDQRSQVVVFQSVRGIGKNFEDEYEMRIRLKDMSGGIVHTVTTGVRTMDINGAWTDVLYAFEMPAPENGDVAELEITEKGKDIENWRGHYGARLRYPMVIVVYGNVNGTHVREKEIIQLDDGRVGATARDARDAVGFCGGVQGGLSDQARRAAQAPACNQGQRQGSECNGLIIVSAVAGLTALYS